MPPLSFCQSIKIDGVTFSYESSQKNIIGDFSLEIPKNSSVAFIGATGCGKTTLVDIILGLLKPRHGRILVDGRNIEENLSSWQRMTGYVPQFIYLLDSTVRENVAFGVPAEQIDDEKIIQCLKTAQLFDFIDSLPDKLNTVVGERGVRFSGGQRQRIGIARALYAEPQLLVFDEATSSLDNDTEKAVIDAVNVLKGKLTIIMIAHRLSTVEKCNRIIDLNSISAKPETEGIL